MWWRNDNRKGAAGHSRVETAKGVAAAPQSRIGFSGTDSK